ncbi:hypothetical protein ILUMI_20654 [Ignelater luminosus]|uniref:Coiled-coil domain-containing protein 12 n=1 Tax=Ignelater luminosus TaxID=2038154 RepID=A0A8K0CDW1_IGNLU|nr:hypothetical protein ILUMI_20654 [Ignelater luminosus]
MVIKMSETNVGKLEEAALKRKQKLQALKRKREGDTSEITKSTEHITLPKPKFRNYKPDDEKLTDHVLLDAQPGNVESEVKEQLESARSKVVMDELDITSLAPRKPDWDLKRDVAKKLEKLERRTQKAIAELIRERLKERQAEDFGSIADVSYTPNEVN